MTAATTLVDAVLVVLAVEAAFLAAFGRRVLRRVAFRDIAPNLAAGFFLVVALRIAVGGHGAWPMAACLALGGIAHVVDLLRRRR